MNDKVVILGYYTLGAFFTECRTTPKVGRTVFCGYLLHDPNALVEIELALTHENGLHATALMRRVGEYDRDMTRVARDFANAYFSNEDYTPTDNALVLESFHRTTQHSCAVFCVDNEGWRSGKQQPFTIHKDLFVDAHDKVVVLGYYTLGAFFGEFTNAHERRIAIPRVGRTVFCGHLLHNPDVLVEVELALMRQDNMVYATALMHPVYEYAKDMTYLAKDYASAYLSNEAYTPTDNALVLEPFHRTTQHSCDVFCVDDEGWQDGHQQPFTIRDDLFIDTYTLETTTVQ
jgi:hypothetical protein